MAESILRRPVFEAIEDERVREALQWMWEYLKAEPLLQGEFQHFELNFTAAVVNQMIPHRLGFVPRDIIETSTIGSGTITFNMSSFTSDAISVTTTGPVRVRFFGGSYSGSDNLR